jgi:arginyl-tRNA synthetase
MGNAFAEYKAFPFDLKIHVVASEQAGYFQVVFKALELIDPEKFNNKQYHLSMGMVQFSDRKMSSRTGDIVTVDGLLDLVKEKVQELITEGRIESDRKAEVAEQITLGAVKHSVLKVNTGQDAAFDINRSVSLEGDIGPYLQYSYARTQSVLRKSGISNAKYQMSNVKLEPEELQLLRLLSRFDEVVMDAAERYAPNTLATYLYDLASAFNLFYQKQPILKAEGEMRTFRLGLTEGVGKILSKGLDLLGIKAPEKM